MHSANRSLALLFALAAGCGNYGNLSLGDSAYLNALPGSQDLKVDVPRGSAQPACLLGESRIAADTRKLAVDLSGGVVGVLTIIDFVKSLPPSARDAASRTWGPFADREHPGVTDLAVVTRLSDEPRFGFQLRQKRTGDFVTVLSAEFVGAQAHSGQGTLRLDWSALSAVGTSKPGDPQVGHLDIAYDLASDPRTLHLANVGTPTGTDVAIASYLDGQASVALTYVDATSTPGTVAQVQAVSKFTKAGAGTAQWKLTAGNSADDATECWDALYCRTYLNDIAGWTSPPCTKAFCIVGDKRACPSVH